MDSESKNLFGIFRKRSLNKVSPARLHSQSYDDEDDDESDILEAPYDFEKNAVFSQQSVRSTSAPEVRTLARSDTTSYSNSPLQAPIFDLAAKEKPKYRRVSKNPLGLTAIATPATPLIDLIFLHGLGGGSLTTWSWNHDSRKCWLRWLADEMELSLARIWTYGYSAPVWGASSGSSINDLAKDLLFKMKYEALQTEPIGSVSSQYM
ncbi:hypothetical protein BKA66DRAFT_573378 [Pyrenochaeta sp. MPI-SDFR-AT-0127]|nr:hypothetical protein BKA66DRAFT_573378 [Pyrenochaeta sp. MPI-SDFR-AT-0127]